jgi:pyrimidine deaminase RibD-like protein
MHDTTLARRILEKLDDAFPSKLHLHELRAALPEHQDLPLPEWLLAVEALRAEDKLNGKFLEDGTSLADAAALFITERGRLCLQELADRKPTGASDTVPDDRRFAQLAIDEARSSVPEDGRVHPRVGAVVVKNGEILARAHRGEIPGCHAEYIVLDRKLPDLALAGATVYTTLEPCIARNPPKMPCATRLVERRVARVVIGMLDPNPDITGRGQRELRRAGITTDLFPPDLMAEVEEMNREFTRVQDRHGIADGAAGGVSEWEVRYPGCLDDVSMIRGDPLRSRARFAIARDFTFVNKSPHRVSLNITLLIVYGHTQLAVEPRNLLPEWERLLAAFGVRTKQQLLFPLNLDAHSAIAGHILFSVPPEGAGRGIAGDVPEKRQYLFEIEDLQTRRRTTLSATAVYSLDKGNHWRVSQTDLARPGPLEEPWIVEGGEIVRPAEPSSEIVLDLNLTDKQMKLLATVVSVYRSGCHTEFLVARSHTGAGLVYPRRDAVPIVADDTDFERLAAEKLIDLGRNAQGLLRGKPTAFGIQYASSVARQPAETARLLSVFLCHSSSDKRFVRALAVKLRESGMAPWLDEEQLLPGQDWEMEIRKAVRASDAVVVCLSNSSISKSGYVQKEIEFALDVAGEQPEGSIFLIPARLDDCDVPERLKRRHYVDLHSATGYDRLVAALNQRARTLGRRAAVVRLGKAGLSAGAPHAEVRAESHDQIREARRQFEPHLEYGGISGDGSYSNNPLGYPQLVEIRNTQVTVPNTAMNVRARIRYIHADGKQFTVDEATWLSKNELEGKLVSSNISSSVSFFGNESSYFVLMQIDRDNNHRASKNMTEPVDLLDVGKWAAEIRVSSDTCESLHGTIGFTVLPDKRLVYDRPAFRSGTVGETA